MATRKKIDATLLRKRLNELNKAIHDPKLLRPIGKKARDLIRKRTRLGYGVKKEGAEREKLDKLSDTYIEQRKKKAVYFQNKNKKLVRVPMKPPKRKTKRRRKRGPTSTQKGRKQYFSNLFPKLGPGARPSKSNLTQTGHMLRSMVFRVISNTRVAILFVDSFAKQKAKWADEGSISKPKRPRRPFMHLSRLEKKQIINLTGRLLRQILKTAKGK